MKGLTFRIFSFELHRTTICVFERLFGFATNQGKARQKDNTRAGMVRHQIVVSRPYCSKNGAFWRMRGIGQVSGLSAEYIVGRSCCLFARIP